MIPRLPAAMGISKSDKGLEIAPWFNPLVSKAEGYNVKIADVLTAQELLASAEGNDTINPDSYGLIEEIDFVGSATELGSVVPKDEHGSFDYIYSSHNFEHLPNPIKFLQACEALLKPGGRLIMIVPDGRLCFDHFRPPTTTSEWLEAYREDRKKPTEKQIFDSRYVLSREACGAMFKPVNHQTPPELHRLQFDPAVLWEQWQQTTPESPYQDAHCTVMTPSSLRLMLQDCQYLGLSSLQIEDVKEPMGIEFMVVMRKPAHEVRVMNAEDYADVRLELLHRVWKDQGWRETRFGSVQGKHTPPSGGKRSQLKGSRIGRILRELNYRRLKKRRSKP